MCRSFWEESPNQNRDKQIEEDVTAALSTDLEAKWYVVTPGIPEEFLKLLNPDGTILVQWDGAVACEKDDQKLLILIEAKHFLRKEQVTDMAIRMQRTEAVMTSPLRQSGTRRYRQQCGVWGVFADFELRAAIGGPVVSNELKRSALGKGYYCVCKREHDPYVVYS